VGSDGGGIGSLGATLNQYWDAVEADFERYYQRDLRYAIKDLGARRLYALVKNLPPDAALWRSMPQETNGDQPQKVGGVTDVRESMDPNVIHAWMKQNVG
jgi:hypothetical protein